eukprot:6570020-Prorocentrum_lima.AAC.1
MDSKRPYDCQSPSREGGNQQLGCPKEGAWACQPVGSPVLSVDRWASVEVVHDRQHVVHLES